MDAETIADTIGDPQGWNDQTLLTLLFDFLNQHPDPNTLPSLRAFLQEKADEENAGAGALLDPLA